MKGFGRFLNHDPCGALGDDFVLKVHAAVGSWSLLFGCRMIANGYSRGQLKASRVMIPLMRIVAGFSHSLTGYSELPVWTNVTEAVNS